MASGPPSARVPAPLTPLVARDGRVERAWQALQGARLLTLTGPGGSGKTRLAMELASRCDVAAWVELASLGDPRLIAEYVATALGVPDRTGRSSISQIADRFGSRPLLLVLDNCEHLVAPCAAFVAQLLRECPAMKVLATSRDIPSFSGSALGLSDIVIAQPRDGSPSDLFAGHFPVKVAVNLILDLLHKALRFPIMSSSKIRPHSIS